MPAATNLTIKKYDGTTDQTFTVLTGSAGDRIPAIWRNESFAAIVGNRPVFSLEAKSTADKMKRVVEAKFFMPELFTTTTTGVTAVRLRDVCSAAFTLDQSGADTTHQEAIAQFLNLMNNATVRAAIISGYALS